MSNKRGRIPTKLLSNADLEVEATIILGDRSIVINKDGMFIGGVQVIDAEGNFTGPVDPETAQALKRLFE